MFSPSLDTCSFTTSVSETVGRGSGEEAEELALIVMEVLLGQGSPCTDGKYAAVFNSPKHCKRSPAPKNQATPPSSAHPRLSWWGP